MAKRRSGEAVAAQHRKAGPLKHRLTPRGGTKDDQAELLEEVERLRHPPAGRTCSQWGCHPHEMEPDHETEGGIGELYLGQLDPPEFKLFHICLRCAHELFEGGDGCPPDTRFRWVRRP